MISKKVFTIYMTEKAHVSAKIFCAKQKMSLSKFIEAAVAYYIVHFAEIKKDTEPVVLPDPPAPTA